MIVESGWGEFLAHQAEVWTGLDIPSRLVTVAALGGWGSGKSEGVVRTAIRHGLLNPHTPAYGSTLPTTIVLGPTSKVLNTSTRRSFEKCVPKSLLAKPPAKTAPYEIRLRNGHSFLFWSAEAEFEGASLTGVVCDEIAHRNYQAQDKWMNIISRVRDPEAPKLTILVAGLPEQGWVREHFEVRPDSKNAASRRTVLSGMADNLYLPQETIDTYRANCPAGQEQFFLEGRWRMPEGAIYARFDSAIHVQGDELRPNVITHAAFDFGERSHVLVFQEIQIGGQKALLFGDEIHLEGADTPAQSRALSDLCARRQLRIGAGSTIIVDPTAKSEQIKPVRDAFAGARVMQTQRGDPYHEIEDGIRCAQRALMDSTGVVRVRFERRLVGRRHGVIDAIQSYRRNPQTQIPVRDNLRDHAADTFRYACCAFLPEGSPGWRVIQR